MGHVIAVSGKGGVGKTTLCGLLIQYLCENGKHPVLAVDADANANLNEVLGVEPEITLGELREEIERAGVDPRYQIPTVEIYFNFIGKYLPPHFGEVEMTPEEIEEMKKREARKDRLHQNYLKRKANGKQQEYYERTKAKKKAEMDAKKEEIRQEDIAKGVFVPVSLLPPAEPKKGVASA